MEVGDDQDLDDHPRTLGVGEGKDLIQGDDLEELAMNLHPAKEQHVGGGHEVKTDPVRAMRQNMAAGQPSLLTITPCARSLSII